MRFLKQKTLSKFSMRDQTLFTNQFGLAVMNLTGGLRLPQGTTSQQPDPSKGRWPGNATNQTDDQYADGTIRYNVTVDPLTGKAIGLECFMDGAWEVVRAPSETTIYQQVLTGADGIETAFGPLDKDPVADANIMVYVENVYQHPVINYTVNYNYLGSGDQYLIFTSPVPFGKDVIVYFGFVN